MCVCVSCGVGDSVLCEPFCLSRHPPSALFLCPLAHFSAMAAGAADLAADGTLAPAPVKRAAGGRGRTRVVAVPAAASAPSAAPAAPAAAAGAQEECVSLRPSKCGTLPKDLAHLVHLVHLPGERTEVNQ